LRVKARLLLAILCLLSPIFSAAQVTGEFYLDKTTFAPDEPIFLNLQITNKGPGTATVITAIQDQPFSSGVVIIVSSDPPPDSLWALLAGCSWNGGPFPSITLASGQAHVNRYLLNFGHEISKPGDYWVQAQYLGGAPAVRVHFRVDDGIPFDPSKYQPYVEELKSSDRQTRMDAALILASMAPPSLEDTLLAFTSNPDFRRYAPLAFDRLNTPRSMESMAGLMQGPVTNEQIDAARYLAKTGDQKYYPLLLEAARKNARISAYPAYAAELGGDKILPVLVDMEHGPDKKFARLNAVMAMGYTDSRAAIPLLLKLLQDPDPDVGERASLSLKLLTHRKADQYRLNRDLRPEYAVWSHWWEREGKTSPIYKSTEYGKLDPL
jgi:HEAT repeat protein